MWTSLEYLTHLLQDDWTLECLKLKDIRGKSCVLQEVVDGPAPNKVLYLEKKIMHCYVKAFAYWNELRALGVEQLHHGKTQAYYSNFFEDGIHGKPRKPPEGKGPQHRKRHGVDLVIDYGEDGAGEGLADLPRCSSDGGRGANASDLPPMPGNLAADDRHSSEENSEEEDAIPGFPAPKVDPDNGGGSGGGAEPGQPSGPMVVNPDPGDGGGGSGGGAANAARAIPLAESSEHSRGFPYTSINGHDHTLTYHIGSHAWTARCTFHEAKRNTRGTLTYCSKSITVPDDPDQGDQDIIEQTALDLLQSWCGLAVPK